ncbi:MAG TPA: histidine kinase [Gemmatimonadales bacterium]|nr:histidine kinase [Gemmatimonadales bacterium]
MTPQDLVIVVGVWAAVGLLAIATALAGGAWPPPAFSWGSLSLVELAGVALWVALTIPVLWIARLLTERGGPWPLRLVVQTGAAFAAVLLGAGIERDLVARITPVPDLGSMRAFLPGLDARLLGCALVLTLTQAARWSSLFRARELQAMELEARLAKTKLQVLKMQLQPHFLFNTLNTTAELVHTDPGAADLMITRLGQFLRLSLDHAGHQVVPLRQELDFVKAYLEIEQIRFGDRMTVSYDNPPDVLDAAVPTLLWQPLLENAIKHGRDPHTGEARIEVGARREGADVLLWVRDHGPGIPNGAPIRPNVGLRNTRERVERLYGSAGAFILANAPGGGALATVRLPYTACSAAHTPLPLRTTDLSAMLL